MIFFSSFKNEEGIFHGITEKKEGPVNPSSDIKGRENVSDLLDIKKENLIYSEQVHGEDVSLVKRKDKRIKKGADGLVCSNNKKVLVVKTADCVPIFFYSPKETKIGIIHAGRKGTIKGIIEKVVSFFSFPQDLLVGIGPHIRKENYFLRRKTNKGMEAFSSIEQMRKHEEFKIYTKEPYRNFLKTKNNKVFFNLTGLIKRKLKKSGVERIEDCKIDTFSDPRFYSSRKKKNGRILCFGSFIGLN